MDLSSEDETCANNSGGNKVIKILSV
jgi:hypothetical protein